MLIFSQPVYHLWLHDRITIPFTLSLYMAIWILGQTGVAIYSNFLAGVGKVQLSIYHSLFVMVVNIPLSIWLAGPMGLGVEGVIMASILGAIPRYILLPVQYFKIISGKAKGLWNK